jgi:hypothetical protein
VWFTQDPEVREVVRNRRAAEILRVPAGGGAPPPILPRRTFRFQRGGRDLAAEELPLRRAARGETVEGELMELVHDNGERRILLTRAAPLRAEHGAVFDAVRAAADVTERHRRSPAVGLTTLLHCRGNQRASGVSRRVFAVTGC